MKLDFHTNKKLLEEGFLPRGYVVSAIKDDTFYVMKVFNRY